MSTFILYYTPEDADYLPFLRPIFAGHKVVLRSEPAVSQAHIEIDCKNTGATAVMTTSARMLQVLLQWNGRKSPTLNDFFGSIIPVHRKLDTSKPPIEALVLNPLQQFVTVPYGKFLFERFCSKLTKPDSWYRPTEFVWEEIKIDTWERVYETLKSAEMIAVDVETVRSERAIHLVSYTGLWWDKEGKPVTISYVLQVTALWAVSVMRAINNLPAAKVLQNGKYDCAMFFRYNAPLENYRWDTINAMHSLYSELPKRLDFTAAFFLRNVQFWKDEGKTGFREDEMRYNARDGWATLNAMLAWFREAPPWAMNNYLLEFPLVFPCHLAEMQGIKADVERMREARQKKEQEIAGLQRSLETMLGTPGFNPASPKQMLVLLHILGNDDLKSSDETNLKKAMYRHPLAGRILQTVLKIRKARKVVSTYLVEEKLWNGRVYFNLNPHGTDTARLASTESHYECGVQIQNVPRGPLVKQCYISDDGFLFGEADYEQAEARDTAYLSGDTALIAAVESPKDFHTYNATGFFGVDYYDIIDQATEEVKNTEIRDLAKRVNHGANYNMGKDVLIDTMGLDRIFKAAQILGLNRFWTARQIAQFLLDRFDATYPVVRGPYYDSIKYTIKTTKMLVSPFGWTRWCFGDPEKSKTALNAYVAHPSQNLNAGTLNKAYMRIFKEIALKNFNTFRLSAQIHDSTLFQYRVGHDHHIQEVHDLMVMDTPVKDWKGITRILRVPVGIKAGATRWSELKKWKAEKKAS